MLRPAATIGLCLAAAGCGLLGPRTVGPDGLSVYDGDIRQMVRQQRFDDALELAEKEGGSAGDELLSTLNIATIEHYGGRFESSAELLMTADIEIDRRFTKSVSKAALSLITSDRSLDWVPTRLEQPMIHVYAALSYLGMGDRDGAAVESRRLSMLLDEMAPEEMGVDEADYYHMLRYFAGALFESAGEFNDARVAYRHAGLGPAELSGGTRGELGDVVLLVETGFVANRVEQSVNLLLDDYDADYLRHGSERDRYHAASCFSADRLSFAYDAFGTPPDRDGCRRRRPNRDRKRKGDDEDDDTAYLLRIAWPVMQRSVDDASGGYVEAYVPELGVTAEPVLRADLSGARIDEFNSKAPEILIKALARAAVKYAVVDAVADDSDVAQVVGNAITALLERADTRGWTLLPSTMEIVRLRLPPGVHTIEVQTSGSGSSGGSHVLEDVFVEADQLTVVSARAWP